MESFSKQYLKWFFINKLKIITLIILKYIREQIQYKDNSLLSF